MYQSTNHQKPHHQSANWRGMDQLEPRLLFDALPVFDFNVVSDWQSGFTGEIHITNQGDEDIIGWQLDFDFDHGRINSLWNGELTDAQGPDFSVKDLGWNQRIAADGGKVAIGFVGSRMGHAEPTGFKLNGIHGGQSTVEPTLAVTVADQVNESDADVPVQLSLSQPANEPVSVRLSTRNGTAKADQDYLASQNVVVFDPGETEHTIYIELIDDTAYDPNESFMLVLDEPSGLKPAQTQFTVNITDDEVPPVNDQAITFNIDNRWQSGFTGTVTVNNNTAAPMEDWQVSFLFEGNITSHWSSTQTDQQGDRFNFAPAPWNRVIQPGASISFGFTAQANDAQAPYNFQLNAGDNPPAPKPANISMRSAIAVEGDTGLNSVDVPVFLDKVTDQPVTVKWQTHPGTAADDLDYLTDAGRLVFAPGQTEQVIEVRIRGDTLKESTEHLSIQLSNAVGAAIAMTSAELVILDNDATDPPPPPGAGGDKKVIGYFPEWGVYSRDYHMTDIPAESMTHIIYSFNTLSPEGDIGFHDTYAALEKAYPTDAWDQPVRGNMNQMRIIKEDNPHLRTLFAVGGWTLSANFSDVAAGETTREHFAAEAVEHAVTYGFDGIDLDWEYPVAGGNFDVKHRPDDGDNYVLLVQALRRAFDARSQLDGKTYEISVAAPAGVDKFQNMHLAQMAEHIDWFNVMTYDYHGKWDTSHSGHLAPLYNNPANPSTIGRQYNVDYTIQAYLDAGVPASQLVMGIPLYGHSWSGVTDGGVNGLYQPATGAGSGSFERGVYDVRHLYDNINNDPDNWQVHFDPIAEVPYIRAPSIESGMWISYEDSRSIDAKTGYLLEHDLAGAMFWEMSNDIRDVTDPNAIMPRVARTLNG